MSVVNRNSTSVELSNLSMSHTRAFVIEQFSNFLNTKTMSEPVKQVLKQLFEIEAITWILKQAGDFYRFADLKVSPTKNRSC
jgi:hypothetical protein